jgi:hypothetical protein
LVEAFLFTKAIVDLGMDAAGSTIFIAVSSIPFTYFIVTLGVTEAISLPSNRAPCMNAWLTVYTVIVAFNNHTFHLASPVVYHAHLAAFSTLRLRFTIKSIILAQIYIALLLADSVSYHEVLAARSTFVSSW